MPEVVFLPGFMQHADSWSPIAAVVGERYPVKMLDFATWSFEERLEEIRAAGEGCVLVGYSMGGRLALHAAVMWPEAFAGVATIGASGGIDDPHARMERREADEALAGWIETHAIGEVVERWEANPVFASQSPELVAAQRHGRLDHEPADLARLLRSAGQAAQDPVWDGLTTLTTPLLAMAGEHDPRYIEAAERLTGGPLGLPQMEGQGPLSVAIEGPGPLRAGVVVPGAGHAAHLERPEFVARVLVDWLTALARGPR